MRNQGCIKFSANGYDMYYGNINIEWLFNETTNFMYNYDHFMVIFYMLNLFV